MYTSFKYIYIYIYMYVYAFEYVFLFQYMHVYMHRYMNTYAQKYKYYYVCNYVYVCVYTYMYLYMHVWMLYECCINLYLYMHQSKNPMYTTSLWYCWVRLSLILTQARLQRHIRRLEGRKPLIHGISGHQGALPHLCEWLLWPRHWAIKNDRWQTNWQTDDYPWIFSNGCRETLNAIIFRHNHDWSALTVTNSESKSKSVDTDKLG